MIDQCKVFQKQVPFYARAEYSMTSIETSFRSKKTSFQWRWPHSLALIKNDFSCFEKMLSKQLQFFCKITKYFSKSENIRDKYFEQSVHQKIWFMKHFIKSTFLSNERNILRIVGSKAIKTCVLRNDMK